jgi:hypothetical protein
MANTRLDDAIWSLAAFTSAARPARSFSYSSLRDLALA